MKSNKNMVLDLLRQCTGEENGGVTTQYLSKRLDMQRTNLSAILNALVREGLVEKSAGRPVLYRLAGGQAQTGDESCFSELVGYDGSLRQSVQLAKAAVLYPQHSLHCLLTGPGGSGKSCFAQMIHRFATENYALEPEAPFVKINCAHFADRPEQLTAEIFGGIEGKTSFLEQAEDGILFIDHGELLPPAAKSGLLSLVENNYRTWQGRRCNLRTTVVCAVEETAAGEILEPFKSRFSVTISLPPLEERPPTERFGLIRRFLTREAAGSGHALSLTSEILVALLLYRCPRQIKQLRNDIRIACANAYVRGLKADQKEIRLAMSDFPNEVRSGLLEYKRRKADLKELIKENVRYVFSENQDVHTRAEEVHRPGGFSIYEWIEERMQELKERGLAWEDINTIIGIDIENEFKKYNNSLVSKVADKEQLSKMVNPRIMELVTEFLDQAARDFNRVYPVSVFYGLCLHLNAALCEGEKRRELSSDRIMEMIGKYKEEYALAVKFAGRLEKEFSTRLPIDEVVFLTMFICDRGGMAGAQPHPVLFIAMHGEHVASSMAQVIQSLSGTEVGYYDLPLSKSTREAYPELKQALSDWNRGAGILALYDMGSMRQMIEMVCAETKIPIRAIAFPFTALALDCCRKVMLEPDLDAAYSSLLERYHTLPMLRDDAYYRPRSGNVIITLCMSGEGGAVQIKRYLEKKVHWDNVSFIPLAISGREELLNEVNRIHEKHHILCTVGAFDPQLLDIPFIPVTKVLECPQEKLKLLLRADIPGEAEDEENDRIIMELAEGLQYFGPDQVKRWVPSLVSEMEEVLGSPLPPEKRVGLSVHLACGINRMIGGEETPVNLHKAELLKENRELYGKLRACMVPLEEAFHIRVDDNEYAHILYILRGRNSEN